MAHEAEKQSELWALSETISGLGTLALAGAFTLGAAAPLVKHLQIGAGGSLSGAGTLAASVVNSGLLAAKGGTLTLTGAVSGGTLSADSGTELILAGGGTLSSVLAGKGQLALTSAITLAAGSVLSGSDIVVQAALRLATEAQISESAGATVNLAAAPGQTLAVTGSNAVLNNAGLLQEKSANAQIATGLVNTGLIAAHGGTLSFLGTVTNSGTITASGGAITAAKQIAGSGVLDIGAAGTLSLAAGAASGQVVDFNAGTGSLDIGVARDFAAIISGFAAHDLIDLQQVTATGLSFAADTLTLLNGAQAVASLVFQGSYAANDFTLASDGATGTVLTFV